MLGSGLGYHSFTHQRTWLQPSYIVMRFVWALGPCWNPIASCAVCCAKHTSQAPLTFRDVLQPRAIGVVASVTAWAHQMQKRWQERSEHEETIMKHKHNFPQLITEPGGPRRCCALTVADEQPRVVVPAAAHLAAQLLQVQQQQVRRLPALRAEDGRLHARAQGRSRRKEERLLWVSVGGHNTRVDSFCQVLTSRDRKAA